MTDNHTHLDPATKAVALGRGAGEAGDPLSPPVALTSTYRFGGRHPYGRDGNDTWLAFEEVLGAMEGGAAMCFASGLAAVSAVFDELPVGAVVVAPGDAYNGTRRLLADREARGRLTRRLVDVTDTAGTVAALVGADLLWVESPTNPLMGIADLEALSAAARAAGVRMVVDNTFATPLLQRPLSLGADLVVHSVTKLLSGHSDVVMGAVVGREEASMEGLVRLRSLHGAIAGPFEAWLALRGMRTLPARLERAQRTALVLAERLAEHAAVDAVRYPGLESHPNRELAERQMSGPGTMIAFDVAGGAEPAEALCGAVRLCVSSTSLGGVETQLERRGRWGGEQHLPPGLIRLSVGQEDVEDLWSDLSQALDRR
jgi:cystathionine gamma-synthase